MDSSVANDESRQPRSLREWRMLSGCSIGDIAIAAFVPSDAIVAIESGLQAPTDDVIERLCVVLGVSAGVVTEFQVRADNAPQKREGSD